MKIWYGADWVTMKDGHYNTLVDGAVVTDHEKIVAMGALSDFNLADFAEQHDFGGGIVTPGLVDCHTHAVFGGNRASEYEMRLQGASYADIAKQGGGILSSVKNTRQDSHEQLFNSAKKRLLCLLADGVTTVEIKSGYGLTLADEIKMLEVAKNLGEALPVDVVGTCLAAHAVPPELKDNPSAWLDIACEQLIPHVAKAKLASAVDVFCEHIAFDLRQTEKVFQAAKAHGLAIKIHAEQLSAMGGSSLAASYQALSADHLEYLTEDDVLAMAKAGTVAVLLPGATLVLKEKQMPPIALLRQHGVRIAISTDLNPGTSPSLSLRLMMALSSSLFGLTPEENLAGVTIQAAHALGLQNSIGTIETHKLANFVHWQVAHPAELTYWLGGQLPNTTVYRGEIRNG